MSRTFSSQGRSFLLRSRKVPLLAGRAFLAAQLTTRVEQEGATAQSRSCPKEGT
jgi:hypothetical protein